MAGLVRDICERAGQGQLAGLGVGVPGVFDPSSGHTLFLPNLPGTWRNVPVGPVLHQELGCPVRLINDARAFVLAEATYGAGRGAETVVGLTLGTGIGGGIVLHGRLHEGMDGSAGEIGHHTVDPNGPPCGCGNRGCLETYASGPSIAAQGMRAVAQGMTTRIAGLVEHDLNRITPETIMRAAEQGDAVACDILARAGDALGIGIANMVTVLSPEVVVLGGSVARLGEWLFAPVRAMIRRRCHVTPIERVQILPAALGGDAGVIGAAIWAGQDA
jgi:glucokinase